MCGCLEDMKKGTIINPLVVFLVETICLDHLSPKQQTRPHAGRLQLLLFRPVTPRQERVLLGSQFPSDPGRQREPEPTQQKWKKSCLAERPRFISPSRPPCDGKPNRPSALWRGRRRTTGLSKDHKTPPSGNLDNARDAFVGPGRFN